MSKQVFTCIHDPVEVQLRGDLNTYGSFCITLPLAQTAATFKELRDINDEWDVEIKSNPSALRNLDVWTATYVPYMT